MGWDGTAPQGIWGTATDAVNRAVALPRQRPTLVIALGVLLVLALGVFGYLIARRQ